MAVLMIDSDDSIFLNLIFEQVRKYKGVKVKYIDKEYLFNKDIDTLNEVEAKYVVDTLLEEAENDDEYSLEEVQQKLSESFAKWGKD